ncbi:MAG: hypothetical protein Q9P01_05380 [Anaerolineae bacterium]|nr:hypothetical protein [Anaerolineae bacterium]MDQ7034270.1 hypothetical protein [Anaerolineae bacterium]
MTTPISRIFLSLIIVMLWVSIVSAQDSGSETPIDAQIDQIESDAELLRGLEPTSDVPIMFPSREEVRDYLNGELEDTFTPEYLDEVMAFYVAFDFLAPDADIQALALALYAQQVIGYYRSDTQTMNIVTDDGQAPDGTMNILDRVTYAHEYIHALQDQYFDLTEYEEALENSTNYDSNLAFQSLIEGDATFIMNEYLFLVMESTPPSELLQLGLDSLNDESLRPPADTPDIFLAELFFPYFNGEQFVRAIFNEGGWEALNKLYEFLPQSSEHILHPEAYLAGDQPQIIDLPANAPDGYELALSGTLGEFYLRQWLGTQLSNERSINDAAAGWGGDTFNIYRNSTGELAWELRISWDSVEDAEEFSAALQAFIEGRLPDSTATMGDVRCVTGEQTLCVTAVDVSTFDITFAPTVEVATALLN